MIISVRPAAFVSCIVLHLGVTEPALAAQALPPPHDGDIRVVYSELRDETTVSLTLEPKRADGTPTPPGVLLTLTLNITGRRPEQPPEYIEMRAYAGFMWAPQVELSVVLNDRERIALAPEGLTGLVGGGLSDYVPARVPLPTLKQIAAAKSVRVKALGLEFELTDSQRQAVRTFVDRILSDDPAQPTFRVGFTGETTMLLKSSMCVLLTASFAASCAWFGAALAQQQEAPASPKLTLPTSAGGAADAKPGGYILQRDADVAVEEPGTHNGGGRTIGYAFFKNAPDLHLVFRKRALHPGSAIGYHLQKEDEIYYVLSGRGEMTIDGKAFPVGPGDAILTRPGSSHGLKQTGAEDLVIMINYLK